MLLSQCFFFFCLRCIPYCLLHSWGLQLPLIYENCNWIMLNTKISHKPFTKSYCCDSLDYIFKMICRSHNTSCNSQLDEGLPHLDKQLDITEFPGIAKGTASTELIAFEVTVELEKLVQCASRFCTEDTFLKIF